MFGSGPATRIYLAAGVTDMRKRFEGLYGLARDRLSCEPLSGHLFLFCNAQRNTHPSAVSPANPSPSIAVLSSRWVNPEQRSRDSKAAGVAVASAEVLKSGVLRFAPQAASAYRLLAYARRALISSLEEM